MSELASLMSGWVYALFLIALVGMGIIVFDAIRKSKKRDSSEVRK